MQRSLLTELPILHLLTDMFRSKIVGYLLRHKYASSFTGSGKLNSSTKILGTNSKRKRISNDFEILGQKINPASTDLTRNN